LCFQSQQKYEESLKSLDEMSSLIDEQDVAGKITNIQLKANVKHDLKDFQHALALLLGEKQNQKCKSFRSQEDC
jgi:hypothetical protein